MEVGLGFFLLSIKLSSKAKQITANSKVARTSNVEEQKVP